MRRHSSSVARRFEELAQKTRRDQAQFEYENQRIIGLTSIPKGAPKQARQIAESAPWSGQENVADTSLRMLVDAHKPLRISRSQRLSKAREAVLDYQYNQASGPTHKERLKVAGERPQRAHGTTSSGLSGGGWIESVAAQHIEDAVARGQFKDIPRGPKAEATVIKGAKAANPMLDFTEYLLNNIIQKQGGTPPWIAKQKAVRERVDLFRAGMRARLRERIVLRAADLRGGRSAEEVVKCTMKDPNLHRDPEWEQHYEAYHHEAVTDLNRAIRGYNLQAPQTARKGYLNVDSEIAQCYATVADDKLATAIRRHLGNVDVPKADRDTLHSSLPPLEAPEKHYGLRELFRDLFTTRERS